MTKPVVSIIMPTFERAAVITKSLESVGNQSFDDYELIIIDDGSVDNTGFLVERYLKEHSFRHQPRYLKQENQGPSSARNQGIALCRAELIAFIDSDDTWNRDKLRKQVDYLNSHLETAMVYSDVRYICPDDQTVHNCLKSAYEDLSSGKIFNNLIKQSFIITSTVMVRKHVFDNSGLFNESMRVSEDWELWLRIAEKYKIDCIKEPLVDYYFHQNNLHKNIKLLEEGYQKIMNRFIFSKLTPMPYFLKRQAIFNYHLTMSEAYERKALYSDARKALLLSLCYFAPESLKGIKREISLLVKLFLPGQGAKLINYFKRNCNV